METRTATDVVSVALTCGWNRRTALAGTKSFLRPGIIQPNTRFRGDECGFSTVAETRGNSRSRDGRGGLWSSLDGGANASCGGSGTSGSLVRVRVDGSAWVGASTVK